MPGRQASARLLLGPDPIEPHPLALLLARTYQLTPCKKTCSWHLAAYRIDLPYLGYILVRESPTQVPTLALSSVPLVPNNLSLSPSKQFVCVSGLSPSISLN